MTIPSNTTRSERACIALLHDTKCEWGMIKQMAYALNLHYNTVRKILFTLEKDGMIERTSRGVYREKAEENEI